MYSLRLPAVLGPQGGRGGLRQSRAEQAPGRRRHERKARRQGFRHPETSEASRRRRGQRLEPPAGPVDDRHGHQAGDVPPALPAVEPGEVVGTHHPDEVHTGESACHVAQRLVGVGAAESGLETCHLDARIGDQPAAGRHACLERRQVLAALQRIAGRHHPPQLIELQPAQGRDGADRVSIVRGVEGAAHQPDALAGKGERHLGRDGWQCYAGIRAWLVMGGVRLDCKPPTD